MQAKQFEDCLLERFRDCFLFSLVPTEEKFGWTGYADGLNEDFMRATPSAISMGSGTTVILTEVACACNCSTRPPSSCSVAANTLSLLLRASISLVSVFACSLLPPIPDCFWKVFSDGAFKGLWLSCRCALAGEFGHGLYLDAELVVGISAPCATYNNPPLAPGVGSDIYSFQSAAEKCDCLYRRQRVLY